MEDAEVGVVVDWKEMRKLEATTHINELPVPKWMKRLIARRRGLTLPLLFLTLAA